MRVKQHNYARKIVICVYICLYVIFKCYLCKIKHDLSHTKF
nr:MAG TPA: hypothetical protein [Caudoviricetes sp.]